MIISTEEFFCDAMVDVDITARQFSAYLNSMIGYIENHDLIDYCVGGLPYKEIILLKYDGIKKSPLIQFYPGIEISILKSK